MRKLGKRNRLEESSESETLSVLMVIENYLPWSGGTERQLAALAQELRKRTVAVEVLTEQRRSDWPLLEKIAETQVYRIPYPKVRWLGTLVLLVRVGRFLLTNGRRFHVFHVHTVGVLAVLTTLIGSLLGKTVILKAVGGWELESGVLNEARRRRPLYQLMMTILRRADAWVAISMRLRTAMEHAGVPAERIVSIPNGVDTARFVPAPCGEGHGLGRSAAPQVVFVGRLVKEKALPVLLHAWAVVTQRVSHAVLNIIGNGPLAADLAQLAQQLGIQSSVRFHGYHENVLPFLQRGDIFVLSSYVEGLANTLLEAMAVGLPVVATRISGSEDVVSDGSTGMLVPVGDVDALAAALLALLLDPAHAAAMGARARQRVVQLCSLEQITSAYVNLYLQLLKKNGVRLCVASPAS